MKNQKGFTLIELVVVIVILGILAAVAVPKFVDMQVDARRSAINGMYAAVQSASSLAHAQFLVQGGSGPIVMEGATVAMFNGYPNSYNDGIDNAVNFDGFTFTQGNPAYFAFDGRTNCRVSYIRATSATVPPVIAVDDACN